MRFDALRPRICPLMLCACGIPCLALRRSYGLKLSPAVIPAKALNRACVALFAAHYSRTTKSPAG